MLEVGATAIFLAEFGPDMLPWVFICVGISVSLSSFGVSRIQQRVGLRLFAVGVIMTTAAVLVSGWVGLVIAAQPITSLVLLLLFTLVCQMAMISLGNQAGRLFDLRQMKRLYPLVMVGWVLGWMLGGTSIPALTGLVRSTANLLIVGAASEGFTLLVLLMTLARFKKDLGGGGVSGGGAGGGAKDTAQPPTVRRYVRVIFAYQMLSAVGTQMVLFLFFTKAQQQYPVAEDLGRFLGWYQGAMNLLSIGALVFLAGRLFRRFGLRLGLAANPTVVLLLLMAMLVQGGLVGVEGLLFFWLVTGARVFDIVATNSMTGTALKISYQVLPAEMRSRVETMVEGVGVPVAFGLTGVILLGVRAIPGFGMVHATGLALGVTVLWILASGRVYHEYPRMLKAAIEQRRLRGEPLELGDSDSLKTLDQGLSSPDPTVVVFALDLLEQAPSKLRLPRLLKLMEHPEAAVRAEVVSLLEAAGEADALEAVTRRLEVDPSAAVRGACLRAVAVLGGSGSFDLLIPFLKADEPELRRGAMVGLIRGGGIRGILLAGTDLLQDVAATDPTRRQGAARVVSDIGIADFYDPLLELLQDQDPAVRREALQAAGELGSQQLWPEVVEALTRQEDRGHAKAALVQGGAPLEPLARAFEQEQTGDEARVAILQVLGRLTGAAIEDYLLGLLEITEEQLRDQLFIALHRHGFYAEESDQRRLVETQLQRELDLALEVAEFACRLPGDSQCEPLQTALLLALKRIRTRALLLASFLHESETVNKAREQLQDGSASQRSFALEALDVNLPQSIKAGLMPLVSEQDPPRLHEALAQQLAGASDSAYLERAALMADQRFTPWIQACAA